MVAAHTSDLKAAAGCGLRTAHVARPNEHGPGRGEASPTVAGRYRGRDLRDACRQARRLSRMTEQFDIVVAGAGHNSLVAAAYLAKAGYRCLVLEGRPVLGGNCVTEELTLPGFRHDSCGTAHVLLQDNPMLRNDELGLATFGLEYIHPEIVVHAPFRGRKLSHPVARSRSHLRGVCQILAQGRRRLPAHDHRL